MSSPSAAVHPFLSAPRAGEALTTGDPSACRDERGASRRAPRQERSHDATTYVAELRRTLEAIGWR
jgi:hypothetical protein